jgi:hypothetical protein
MITIEELRDKILSIKRYKDNITKTKITKNGLFIYGGYYKTSSGEQHPIYTYISKLELNDFKGSINYIIDLLETFVDEVERLREAI